MLVDSERDDVFPFFADAHNLERLTPDFMQFRVVTKGDIQMTAGTILDYKLRIRGIPVSWRSLIRKWNPPAMFEDIQLKGPYSKWHHTNEFEALGHETLIRDTIRYRVPGGRLINGLLVAPDLRKIFAFRHQCILTLFSPPPHLPEDPTK